MGVPRIIFNYQNQPARLEPSGKAFRRGGPRLPVPDPFGQGLATGMAPATVNPALLGKWYGPAERNRSAALQAPHLAPIPLRVWFWPASPYPGSKQPAEETMKRTMMICALACTAIAATCTPSASQSRIQAGVLECRGAPSAGYLLGSVHPLQCWFRSNYGPRYPYYGLVRRFGLDIGFTQQSTLGWAVFAPTRQIGPGDLAGNYAGVTAGAAVVVGGNANALIGGSNNSFALQPLSFEGQTGLNIALGVASLELRPAGPGSGYVGRRQHHRKHVYR